MNPDQAVEIAHEAFKNVGYDARSLPPSLRTVFLISDLEYEVMLGGVYGWLSNKGGYGPDVAKALETVGAPQAASVVREVLAFFPGGTPAFDDQERSVQIHDVFDVAEPHWSEMGDRLLAWPDDIRALLQRFVTQHEADFS